MGGCSGRGTSPYTALISDALYGGGGNPHPRLYGAFPRMLRKLVREEGVLSFEQAVYKMTAMPAQRAPSERQGRSAAGRCGGSSGIPS